MPVATNTLGPFLSWSLFHQCWPVWDGPCCLIRVWGGGGGGGGERSYCVKVRILTRLSCFHTEARLIKQYGNIVSAACCLLKKAFKRGGHGHTPGSPLVTPVDLSPSKDAQHSSKALIKDVEGFNLEGSAILNFKIITETNL